MTSSETEVWRLCSMEAVLAPRLAPDSEVASPSKIKQWTGVELPGQELL